jgi:DinB superfamily
VDTVTGLLLGQLDFYLKTHLFPRLEGLEDEEFFWEPVPNCWSVVAGPEGWVMEQSWPEPSPPPVTTIAWRLAHVAASNIGTRANAFFGDTDVADAESFNDPRFSPPIPGSAAAAIALLHEVWERWRDGLAHLGDAGLLAPIGPFGGWFAQEPMAALVLHVSRETVHHGGEIGLLRDLYRAQPA